MKRSFCQSCGMPLKKDKGGGTNADKSLNPDYCSYCYQEGKFTFEGEFSEFQEFCKRRMIENGHSRLTAWLMTRGIKRLKRWQ
ncbi:Putative zinc ribbon domain protein [Limihaloglobus sulfuriphilus]|uniref:Putative zinc ribbon domain protein n=1 Tax=Limihaloglobus sulfuriphilus TaxID=1851148 RepID=A0A1Q2MBX0_9BACT|nr:zinc ribbon domain-containing protein [Limihaloglobus sulfuriphilus]AQQ70213.1 Putative zinc ribbon domain protein [Limihaloglobus sulfuriphilus]